MRSCEFGNLVREVAAVVCAAAFLPGRHRRDHGAGGVQPQPEAHGSGDVMGCARSASRLTMHQRLIVSRSSPSIASASAGTIACVEGSLRPGACASGWRQALLAHDGPNASRAASLPAISPYTRQLALESPPSLSAPCMPPAISPQAKRPRAPPRHRPRASIAMPPFEACA